MSKVKVICAVATVTTLVTSAIGMEMAKQVRTLNELKSEKEQLKIAKENAESKIIELEGSLTESEKLRIAAEQEVDRMKSEQIQQAKAKAIEESKSLHFNPNNVLESSNITSNKAYKMLSESDLQPLYDCYVDAEEEYGVNAIFLMALTSLESGHGTSSLAKTKNNIGGIKKGNGGYVYFSSKEACIKYIAKLLSEHYLKESGKYYEGKSVWNVNKNYCPDGSPWADKIVEIANNLIENI